MSRPEVLSGKARSADGLLASVSQSLARGHWRVACRRYLMLVAASAEVPAELRQCCERFLESCSRKERARMEWDAARWASFANIAQHTFAQEEIRTECQPPGSLRAEP